MKSKSLTNYLVKPAMLLLLMFLLVNCKDENSIVLSQDPYNTSNDAEAIASGISSETSGTIDQLSYLSDLASENGISNLTKTTFSLAKSSGGDGTTVDTVYDEINSKWIITISRERTISEKYFTSNYQHQYTVQYLRNGIPQKYFILNSDTANTIKFSIVSGSGTAQSSRLNQNLINTGGSWVATINDNNSMVVAGNYSRSANASFTSVNAVRGYNYSLSLNFSGLSVPINKGSELWLYLAGSMSGQFSGDYSATVAGSQYQKSINKSFAIAFSKKLVYNITIEGEQFSADAETGELQ